MGRLSNPPEHLKHLLDRGTEIPPHNPKRRPRGPEGVTATAGPATSEETGRHSNPSPRPVQRRLRASEVDTIGVEYQAGRSLRAIAKVLGVHHWTVAVHLEQLGVPRRVNRRKMNAHNIVDACARYEAGDALATVAAAYGVDAATVRRELHRADVAMRPRRGWG